MGVTLEIYRQRIGSHAARGKRANVRNDHSPERDSRDRPWMANDFCPNCNSSSRLFRLTRPRARAGVMLIVLYASLLAMSMLKPCTLSMELHDLSERILLGGDIESNPGPSDSQNFETTVNHRDSNQYLQTQRQ